MFNENFLLNTTLAQQLYRSTADLPIVDYHNHLPLKVLSENRNFSDIAELWVISDPYKHRAMRICGVPEKFITGNATNRQKFDAWAETLPKLIGNPLYHWSMLELKRVFDIEDDLTPENADIIYKKCNAMLAGDEFKPLALLKRFNVQYSAPCCTINDNVECFAAIPGNVPSLRGDDILQPTAGFIKTLEEKTSVKIDDIESFVKAVARRLELFHNSGCRIADHSLDNGFVYYPNLDSQYAEELFKRVISSSAELDPTEKLMLTSKIIRLIAPLYAERSWLLLLHIGAQRKTSSRLRAAAGPAGGFAGIGHTCSIQSLTAMLDELESTSAGLPRTVLFTLNPADHAAFSVLSGSFPGDGVRGKVQLGPAWWYCDHIHGMRDGFENSAAFGVLSQFIGMTTDSRSILSFVRHEYFRRIFCSFLAEKAASGEMPDDVNKLKSIVKAVCYNNAAEYLGVIK